MTIPACWRTCLDVVLPPLCLLCGGENQGGDLCPRCDQLLKLSWPPLVVACRFCGMPRPRGAAPPLDQACTVCPTGGFPFDAVTPLAIYQGAVREAVVAAKQARSAALARALGVRLAQRLLNPRPTPWPDLVTFIPTPLLKRLQRGGTSGAAAIAMAVGQRLGIPTVGVLEQTRRIAKQSLLPDEQRYQNVLAAFAIKRSYAWKPTLDLRDRHILLIDDVLTTGSTASEVAAVLKRAGAASVHVAVVARAVRR